MIKTMLCLLMLLLAPSAEAQQGTVIHRGNGAEPDSLDIHQAQGLNSHNILFDLYEGLMTLDAAGNLVPGVAATYHYDAEQNSWHFQLRQAAKWSDGTAVVAADFIRAWQRANQPETAAPYRHLFGNISRDGELQVSSPNPYELVVQLNQPDASFLYQLTLPVFFPLPAETTSQPAGVSNGAYQLQQWQIQEHITVVKNPHFHAAEQVKTERITFWVTENQHSELLRFRAGQLDITETIPDSQINWLRDNMSDALRIHPYYGTFFLGLNLNDQWLANRQLRQALSLAIDRQILTDKVLKSGQLPATQIIPPDSSAVSKAGFDLQAAKKHLLQSGFKKATHTLEILYNNSDNQKKVALAVAAMWRQNLGIKTRLKSVEWKVFVNARKGPNKQVFRSGWIADFRDPINFLNLFHSQSHFNFYGYQSDNYDALLQQLRQPKPNRTALLTQAESILQHDLPVIPLYHYVSRHLVQPHIQGYIDNDMDRHLSRYLYSSPTGE